jgi:hypothetical protein
VRSSPTDFFVLVFTFGPTSLMIVGTFVLLFMNFDSLGYSRAGPTASRGVRSANLSMCLHTSSVAPSCCWYHQNALKTIEQPYCMLKSNLELQQPIHVQALDLQSWTYCLLSSRTLTKLDVVVADSPHCLSPLQRMFLSAQKSVFSCLIWLLDFHCCCSSGSACCCHPAHPPFLCAPHGEQPEDERQSLIPDMLPFSLFCEAVQVDGTSFIWGTDEKRSCCSMFT